MSKVEMQTTEVSAHGRLLKSPGGNHSCRYSTQFPLEGGRAPNEDCEVVDGNYGNECQPVDFSGSG